MSFLAPRIGLKPLAALCRRLSSSLAAGVDVRTVFLREAQNAHGLIRRRFIGLRDDVAGGTTISDALAQTGDYFPALFRELVQVGETSGHLPEVLRQLADHYELQLRLRRNFLLAIAWPMLELTAALSVVGLLIWLMGAMPQLRKANVDILGFGLTGNRGLMVYLAILAAVGFAVYMVYRATARGLLWVAPLQRLIMSLPGLGRAIETLAMARLSWAMYVTLNSGMDVRGALRMSLASTHNVVYTRHIDRVLREIRQGNDIHTAFVATAAFPNNFLDAVQAAEESGTLVESMRHLAELYQDQARVAMNTLTVLLGMAVAGVIAAVIIFLIFRVFGFYLGTINDALEMRP